MRQMIDLQKTPQKFAKRNKLSNYGKTAARLIMDEDEPIEMNSPSTFPGFAWATHASRNGDLRAGETVVGVAIFFNTSEVISNWVSTFGVGVGDDGQKGTGGDFPHD